MALGLNGVLQIAFLSSKQPVGAQYQAVFAAALGRYIRSRTAGR